MGGGGPAIQARVSMTKKKISFFAKVTVSIYGSFVKFFREEIVQFFFHLLNLLEYVPTVTKKQKILFKI